MRPKSSGVHALVSRTPPQPRGSFCARVQKMPNQCVKSTRVRIAMCSCSRRLLGGEDSRITRPYSIAVNMNCIETEGPISVGICSDGGSDCADTAKSGAACE